MNQNEEATDQLDEVSGRWLRDQLKDVPDGQPSSPEPSGSAAQAEDSTGQMLEGLAASISAAVVGPIRGLEARRDAQHKKLEQTVQELTGKLGDAFVEVAKVRDQAAAAAARVDEARSDAQREIEAVRNQARSEIEAIAMEARGEVNTVRTETRRELDQFAGAAADMRGSFNALAEEIGRLQEKVREQHERIEALRSREAQRAKAMNEMAKASSSLRDAVAAAAAMSAAVEEGHESPSQD